MKIKLVGSSVGEGEPRQFLTSYIVNDSVAIDAGCLGFVLPLEVQLQVHHVVLSHFHADHIASLPILLENRFLLESEMVTIHATQPVLDCLSDCVFNDRVWPNVINTSAGGNSTVALKRIEPGTSIQIADLRIMPIDLDHGVPTVGFVIEDDSSAVVLASDTGPTEAVWKFARSKKNLKGVFLEASFPNRMARFADISKHLTPQLFHAELKKLDRQTPVIAVHIKPALHSEIVNELKSLGVPQLEIGTPGKEYCF